MGKSPVERESVVSVFPHSECKSCGNQIIFDGSCWRHFGLQPRHIAVPYEPLPAKARDLGVVRFSAAGNVVLCQESIVCDSREHLQQIASALSEVSAAIRVKLNENSTTCQQSDEVKHLTKSVEGWKAEANAVQARLHELQIEHMALRAATRGDVWCYQGDGTDFPESLTCPVVMTADEFRELLSRKSDL